MPGNNTKLILSAHFKHETAFMWINTTTSFHNMGFPIARNVQQLNKQNKIWSFISNEEVPDLPYLHTDNSSQYLIFIIFHQTQQIQSQQERYPWTTTHHVLKSNTTNKSCWHRNPHITARCPIPTSSPGGQTIACHPRNTSNTQIPSNSINTVTFLSVFYYREKQYRCCCCYHDNRFDERYEDLFTL